MKTVLASFIGRILSVEGEVATISLRLEPTKIYMEMECDMDLLRQESISRGDEFHFLFCWVESKPSVKFKKLNQLPEDVRQALDRLRAKGFVGGSIT